MAEEKKGFFRRLVDGLSKTRSSIVSGFDNIFAGYSSIDDDFYDEIEEILVMGDIGIKATTNIIDELKEKVKEEHIRDPKECRQILMDSIKAQMDVEETDYAFENQKSVVLVVGVNGVGKTTSIGKLAGLLQAEGKKVIMAAADTFRAAAGEQLTEWAQRAGVAIVSGQEGSDPGSVVYDAIASAKAKDADILLVDEILAVGDENFQSKSRARMMELMHGGATVLFVSHQLQQIREMCNRVVWLNHGQVVECGETNAVCDAYHKAVMGG